MQNPPPKVETNWQKLIETPISASVRSAGGSFFQSGALRTPRDYLVAFLPPGPVDPRGFQAKAWSQLPVNLKASRASSKKDAKILVPFFHPRILSRCIWLFHSCGMVNKKQDEGLAKWISMSGRNKINKSFISAHLGGLASFALQIWMTDPPSPHLPPCPSLFLPVAQTLVGLQGRFLQSGSLPVAHDCTTFSVLANLLVQTRVFFTPKFGSICPRSKSSWTWFIPKTWPNDVFVNERPPWKAKKCMHFCTSVLWMSALSTMNSHDL